MDDLWYTQMNRSLTVLHSYHESAHYRHPSVECLWCAETCQEMLRRAAEIKKGRVEE